MAYRIVLLTKQVEAPFLRQFLHGQNPDLEVDIALNQAELRQAIAGRGADTRLICFNSKVIVPGDILQQLGPVPYNIHPGPPQFPGSYPIAYALRDRAATYGATAHEMVEKVDAGPIVHVEQIAIEPDISLDELTELAFTLGTRVFSFIAIYCAHNADALPQLDISWSGEKSTKKSYRELCQVSLGASEDEIANLRRICGDDLRF